ncbi:DUF4124 domain-containing protein [Pseudomonas phytophila]|uniref:DUF4124 domain-containing protein n=1 Tax=Pseudomonas phytophila TaxID=2867264 RepID=A0ABY6FCE8_9PSED|nr:MULTISPECIES: DUF4124 domain-containing protein [Pseudomonas]PHN30796.1 glycosyltransferase [Pseudomonas sp. ICMP 561]UXZ95554.1 DUF4124 domain-containing protein [Pseudomonas phytophila]
MRCMIIAAIVALALGTTAQAAQIYKWVDDQGVTHFDAQPPAGRQTQQIDTQKPPAVPTTGNSKAAIDEEAEQRAVDDVVKKKITQEEGRRAEDCKILRTNLSQLQNNPRVREQVEGGLKRLSEDERQVRITETQQAIKDYCL